MRVAYTDELLPWMRKISHRLTRVERRREVPTVTTGSPLVAVENEQGLPEVLQPEVGYYRRDLDLVQMADGNTMTLGEFYQRP